MLAVDKVAPPLDCQSHESDGLTSTYYCKGNRKRHISLNKNYSMIYPDSRPSFVDPTLDYACCIVAKQRVIFILVTVTQCPWITVEMFHE